MKVGVGIDPRLGLSREQPRTLVQEAARLDVVLHGSTRGALYKTIHDARVKLRSRLRAAGHAVDPPTEGAAGD